MARLMKSIRTTSMALVAAALFFTALAPTTALADDDWRDREAKAQQKRAKRAAREARRSKRPVVVVDQSRDGYAIDRSRSRSSRRRAARNNQSCDVNGRVYDYRNGQYDPYAPYPQYRRNPYQNGSNYPYNGGYANRPYYTDNREGDIDREEVAERAAQNGYYAGFDRGAWDASRRNRANPQGHGAYEFGFDGYDPEWGSAQTYQQYYRQYFIQGYQDAYNRRSYSSRFPRRRY